MEFSNIFVVIVYTNSCFINSSKNAQQLDWKKHYIYGVMGKGSLIKYYYYYYYYSFDNYIFTSHESEALAVTNGQLSKHHFSKELSGSNQNKQWRIVYYLRYVCTLRLIGPISYLGACYTRTKVRKCIREKMTLYFRR